MSGGGEAGRFKVDAAQASDTRGNTDDKMKVAFAEKTGLIEQGEIKEEMALNENLDDLDLYREEYEGRPRVSSVITRLLHYRGGIDQTVSEAQEEKQKPAGLGTLLGVYFPCLQNIFGVLLFIRLCWIVGVAGAFQAFIIVFSCCCCTMLTAISMSAIATNGRVPAGGSYFMISRSLGPEFGTAVGGLFYLGTTVAGAMYIIGAVEIFLNYIMPQAAVFDIKTKADFLNNARIYGLILLSLMAVCVLIGIKFVSKFATLSLACVLISILSLMIGFFVARPSTSPVLCAVGSRLLVTKQLMVNGSLECHADPSGPVYALFCGNDTSSESCQFLRDNQVSQFHGIPGISSGVFFTNFFPSHYATAGDLYDTQPPIKGDPGRGEGPAIADITTQLVVLLGIFFPSVTGIMAGSNRSGDLAKPAVAIPRGTMAAIATTSFVYLSSVLLFAANVDGRLMRDKFGMSLDGRLIAALLAWPDKWLVMIGSFLSTIGAGLQSLTGAPRLFQAIAADSVITKLAPFKATTARGEPLRAQLFTFGICGLAVLIADIDAITPLITQFFLMCYAFVNMATCLNGLLKEPSWRPSFRYYHWTTSSVGCCLCIVLMFISSWYFAIVAVLIAVAIYFYVQWQGASMEWGDATNGLQLSAAKKALLSVDEKPVHAKNWRPQLLLLLEVNDELQPKHENLLDIVFQLKAGKGLTIVGTVLQGNVIDRVGDVASTKETLKRIMKAKKVKGIAKVIAAEGVVQAIEGLVQSAGLGGLEHNCVVAAFPTAWAVGSQSYTISHHIEAYDKFLTVIRTAAVCGKAVLVPKPIPAFPDKSTVARQSGTVDIWWIVHDGGLLFLLAYLLSRNKMWAKCKLRVFTVAQISDNSPEMHAYIKTYIRQLRLNTDVEVVQLQSNIVSAYTTNRTLSMKNRSDILAQAKAQGSSGITDPQIFVDSLRDSEEAADMPKAANEAGNQFTFTTQTKKQEEEKANADVDSHLLRRMHSAVQLNEVILRRSKDASLVILNMPGPNSSPDPTRDYHYMEYLEALTEGLERVLLVRGSGREVVTISQ